MRPTTRNTASVDPDRWNVVARNAKAVTIRLMPRSQEADAEEKTGNRKDEEQGNRPIIDRVHPTGKKLKKCP